MELLDLAILKCEVVSERVLSLVDNDGTVTSFKVPTFQQALDWAENRAILLLDLKADGFVSDVVDIVTDNNAEDFVMFIANSVEQANTVYGQNPDIHLSLSFQPGSIDSALANIADNGDFPLTSVSSFSCCSGTVNPAEFNQQLHDNGLISSWGAFGIDGDLSSDDAIALYTSEFANGVDVMAGDRYMDAAVAAGFQPIPVQTPGVNIEPAGPNQATISWDPDDPGWVLQKATSLTLSNWVNSASGPTNPITVPATVPTTFYRLHRQ